jgi:hypothetical protein
MEVTVMTRRDRRACRLQNLVSDRQARLAAQLAHLDYRGSSESGALRVYTHSVSWHRAKSPNASTPPPGRGWDRSGPARVVRVDAPNSTGPAPSTGGGG